MFLCSDSHEFESVLRIEAVHSLASLVCYHLYKCRVFYGTLIVHCRSNSTAWKKNCMILELLSHHITKVLVKL